MSLTATGNNLLTVLLGQSCGCIISFNNHINIAQPPRGLFVASEGRQIFCNVLLSSHLWLSQLFVLISLASQLPSTHLFRCYLGKVCFLIPVTSAACLLRWNCPILQMRNFIEK